MESKGDTVPNFLTTVEKVKGQFIYAGTTRDQRVFDAIDFVSRDIESETDRRFIPRIETRYFDWPQQNLNPSWELELDEDLIELISITAASNDDTPVSISLDDVYLGPPGATGSFNLITVKLSNNSRIYSGISFQRAVAVTGLWGHSRNLKSGGLLGAGIDIDDGQILCSDASRVNVGHTVMLDDEFLFVTDRSWSDTGATAGALTDSKNAVAVTSSNGTLHHEGEMILIEAEKMLIETIAGDVLGVIRSYDGTALAAHDTGKSIYAPRLLDVDRHVNGSEPAAHLINTSISLVEAHAGAAGLALAQSIVYLLNNESGWVRKVSGGESEMQVSMTDFEKMRKRVIASYQRNLYGVVVS